MGHLKNRRGEFLVVAAVWLWGVLLMVGMVASKPVKPMTPQEQEQLYRLRGVRP